MTRSLLGLLSLCIQGLTGCGGHAVDLDHPAPAPSTSMGPDAPVVFEGKVSGVWVDQQRLYWLFESDGYKTFLSCLKTDCEHTKLTYVKSLYGPNAVAVAAGHVYWTTYFGIFSCATEGCDKPLLITQDPELRALFGHRDHVYWLSTFDLYRCQAGGCAETPEVVAPNMAVYRLAFDDTHVYWPGETGILSAPSDGSEPARLLIDLRSQETSSIESLAVGAGHLYWATSNGVYRCPIASCNTSAPTLLVNAVGPITAVKVDDSAVYWLEADSVRSCPLSGCEQSTTLTPQVAGNNADDGSHFAVDADYVYWLEAADDTRDSPMPPALRRAKSIRRTAK
jgi:hypothetical protein